jgi:DNA-binding NarL/FixJ family response regulator
MSLSAAAAAHEIKQPLSRILLETQLTIERLQGRSPDPGDLGGYLETVLAESQHVVDMVSRMKALLRNVESKQGPVEVVDVVAGAILHSRRYLASHGVTLHEAGLEVLRAVVRSHPDLRCIVLSSMADELACPPELVEHLAAVIDKTAPLDELRLEVEAEVRRRLGGRPEGVSQDPATVLRPREREVFGLIGKGMTSRQIAATLGIRLPTVNTHRQAIASKLGVAGAELVRLATVYNQTR